MDEETTAGQGQASESTPVAPDTSTETAGVAGSEAGVAAPEIPGYFRDFQEAVAARDEQWRAQLAEQHTAHMAALDAQQKAQTEWTENFRRTFDPEYAQRQTTPQYTTQEDSRRMYEDLRREMREELAKERFAAEYDSGMEAARAKYPALFSGPTGEQLANLVEKVWIQDGGSILDYAKTLDEWRRSAFDEQQKAVLEGKAKTKAETGGGAVRSGGAASGPRTAEKGFARLRAITEKLVAGG